MRLLKIYSVAGALKYSSIFQPQGNTDAWSALNDPLSRIRVDMLVKTYVWKTVDTHEVCLNFLNDPVAQWIEQLPLTISYSK